MRTLRLTFGRASVTIKVEKDDQLRVLVNEKTYWMSRKDGVPTFTDPVDDLPQDLQAHILHMAAHYFTPQK